MKFYKKITLGVLGFLITAFICVPHFQVFSKADALVEDNVFEDVYNPTWFSGGSKVSTDYVGNKIRNVVSAGSFDNEKLVNVPYRADRPSILSDCFDINETETISLDFTIPMYDENNNVNFRSNNGH